MIFLLKNWKLFAGAFVVIAIIAVGYYIYHKGGDAREHKIEKVAIETEEKVQDEKDRIRNNSSFELYADKLLNGSF